MNRDYTSVLMLVILTAVVLVAPWALAQAVATAQSNWDGVTIDLLSAQRKGSVLTLKWEARNTGSTEQEVRFGLVGDRVTTYVVDEESGTKYYALTDAEGHAIASASKFTEGSTYGVVDKVPPGGTRLYWAKFPAPPAEVKTMTVLFSNAEPLEEVAITDR